MTAEPPIRLHPNLERPEARAAIAERLRQHGRAHIPGILDPAAAQRLHRCLVSEVPWNVIFNEGDKVHALAPQQYAALTPDKQAWLANLIRTSARQGFQYIYCNYPVWDLYQRDPNQPLYVFRLLEFLNSEPFLDFVREISGVPTIAMADSQVTLFKPHHFLTGHTDLGTSAQKRKLAYVLNLTPEWRTEWGGILEFTDPAGNVLEGFIPSFNALNLFHVPTPHHVSYVTPFAGAGRYSMTGWLRER